MTTIIIVVVVALVFFVSLCVVTFMVWKREEEMRTDSLKSIEANLQELGYRMTSDLPKGMRRSMSQEEQFAISPNIPHVQKQTDPFEWTRASDNVEVEAMPLETETATMQSPAEPMADANVISGQDAPMQRNSISNPDVVLQPESLLSKVDDLLPETGDTLPKGASTMTTSRDTDEIDEHLIEPFAQMDEDISDDSNEIISDEEILEATLYDETPLEAIKEDDTFEVELPDDIIPEIDTVEVGAPEMEKPADDIFDKLAALDSEKESAIQDDEFEINLDGLEVPELEDGYFAEYSPENIPVAREPIGFDVGRSGRKYTAEELDMLIKE